MIERAVGAPGSVSIPFGAPYPGFEIYNTIPNGVDVDATRQSPFDSCFSEFGSKKR